MQAQAPSWIQTKLRRSHWSLIILPRMISETLKKMEDTSSLKVEHDGEIENNPGRFVLTLVYIRQMIKKTAIVSE